MAKQKLQPRNIVKVCTECGCDRWSHAEQTLRDPVDFGNGKSVRAHRMFCRRCRKNCGISTRIGFS